jgi:hypothetical protein
VLWGALATATPTDIEAVNTVVDDFNQAAATADETAYFGAMGDDGVFIGTDATERGRKRCFVSGLGLTSRVRVPGSTPPSSPT